MRYKRLHPVGASVTGRLRSASWLLALAGLIHVLLAGTLLRAARWGYDRVLAVDFSPRASATVRVRLIGLAWIAAAVALRRLASALGGE